MKTLLKNILFIIAMIPQLIFKQYEWVLISIIVIGFTAAFFINHKKVFIKILILELIVFSILFFIRMENIFYFDNVFENFGISKLFVPIIFIIFNVLNISILFIFGYKLQVLMFKKITL